MFLKSSWHSEIPSFVHSAVQDLHMTHITKKIKADLTFLLEKRLKWNLRNAYKNYLIIVT